MSDELWSLIKPLLPEPPPKQVEGRPRAPDRQALCGILFVLHTGIQWEYLPQEPGFGSGMTCWRRLAAWNEAGVWNQPHQVLLSKLRSKKPAGLAAGGDRLLPCPGRTQGLASGPSLVDRARPGSKHHIMAVDVSPWLRSDAPCSAERLFCHAYGRAKTASQFIPGRPNSCVAALEPGATSWTAILDAVRLGPTDDATAITAAQLRGVVERLIAAGQWQTGDPHTVIVSDADYGVTRLAWVLRPVGMVGRVRSDRVMRLPKPPRMHGVNGRPPKHGPQFHLNRD